MYELILVGLIKLGTRRVLGSCKLKSLLALLMSKYRNYSSSNSKANRSGQIVFLKVVLILIFHTNVM